jgi:hypothetical protein
MVHLNRTQEFEIKVLTSLFGPKWNEVNGQIMCHTKKAQVGIVKWLTVGGRLQFDSG